MLLYCYFALQMWTRYFCLLWFPNDIIIFKAPNMTMFIQCVHFFDKCNLTKPKIDNNFILVYDIVFISGISTFSDDKTGPYEHNISDENVLFPYIRRGTLILENDNKEIMSNQKLQWRTKLRFSNTVIYAVLVFHKAIHGINRFATDRAPGNMGQI